MTIPLFPVDAISPSEAIGRIKFYMHNSLNGWIPFVLSKDSPFENMHMQQTPTATCKVTQLIK
jgi:hypothetical protein